MAKQVGVLMSSYRGERFICRQIDSILAQKGCDVHLYVRDDGSDDRTAEILKRYERDGRLTLFQGENVGPARSFLSLVKLAGVHDYYAFADQDDIWYEEKLLHGTERLEGIKNPALCYANAELITAAGEKTGILVYRRYHPQKEMTIACAGAILGCTIVFNRELAEYIKKYPLPEKIRVHDYYLAQVCVACGGSILYSPTVDMGYRQHDKNVIGMKAGKREILKQRLRDITEVRDPSAADQAAEICAIYGACMSTEKKRLFSMIAGYRRSLLTRGRLGLLFDGKDVSRSMRIKYRLMIFGGKL